MAGQVHTPRVRVLWTNVLAGGQDRDVIWRPGQSLTLLFGLSIDTALWHQDASFVANFQITEVASGQRFNNYWRGPLSALPKAPSIWLSKSWTRAEWAGVNHGSVVYGSGPLAWTQVGDGMYLYRPYIEILVPRPNPAFIFLPGAYSEFAVGEEHFLLAETD
jgi:hypothetical protein